MSTSQPKSAKEDDEVKILEGLKTHVVAVYDDEVIVETEDGRPKFIKRAQLALVEASASAHKAIWKELPKSA